MPCLHFHRGARPTDETYVPKPAEFLRSQLRLRIAVFATTVAVAAVLGLMGVWWWPAIFLALGLLFVLVRLAGEGRVLDPENLRSGILGEEAVADALAVLPSSYWVLHGVLTGHGDVDHVVIGPTGVFALETKAWRGSFYRRRGQLYCNGKPAEQVLRQARGAAGQVRQLLLEAGIDEWVERSWSPRGPPSHAPPYASRRPTSFRSTASWTSSRAGVAGSAARMSWRRWRAWWSREGTTARSTVAEPPRRPDPQTCRLFSS